MRQTKFIVFFSWQSDVKGNTKIIRDSIKAECQKQREQNGYEVKIDEATRDMPGSPKIEDAVLEKIEHSDIFVCDITPIIQTSDGKQMPNSNVIFELGYAFNVLGDKRIIMLAKQGAWKDKDMPFDFNHRRIGKFNSSKDCNLYFEIDSCIKECIKHPRRRKLFQLLNYKLTSCIFNREKDKKSINNNHSSLLKATEESTVFFARRMASAFHGIRGLEEITDLSIIRRDLSILLQSPLHFAQGLDKADVDPIWWFRGGSALDIKRFALLWPHKVLIDFDELRIKRILVYRDTGRYYSQYVYVETIPDKSTGLYKSPSADVMKDIMKFQGYYDEEYADFKPIWFLPTRHISRQDYDDGATTVLGKHIELRQRAELRARYLTPYNFIICAKFSAYNNHTFSRTSESFFRGMLDGSVTNEEFHEYMMKFPKPTY